MDSPSAGRGLPLFSDARNLESITPPWLRFRIVKAPDRLAKGAIIEYELAWRLFPLRWRTEITRWDPPTAFVDIQVSGPYSLWEHTHTFRALNGGTQMSDRARYALPLRPLGRLAHWVRVGRDLRKIFEYRRVTIERLFAARAS